LVEDQLFGRIIELDPQVKNASSTHELVEVLLNARNFSIRTDGGIGVEELDLTTNRWKVVIVKNIHLLIGHTHCVICLDVRAT